MIGYSFRHRRFLDLRHFWLVIVCVLVCAVVQLSAPSRSLARTGVAIRVNPIWSLRVDYVEDLAFSWDGKYFVATSTAKDTEVWRVLDRKRVFVCPAGRSVAFSPDGRWLAVGQTDDSIRIYRTKTWAYNTSIHLELGVPTKLIFTADGRWLIGIADNGRGIHSWRTKTWQEEWHETSPRTMPSFVISSNSGRIWTACGSALRCYDLLTGALLANVELSIQKATAIELLNGSVLVGGNRGELLSVNTVSGNTVSRRSEPYGSINAIAGCEKRSVVCIASFDSMQTPSDKSITAHSVKGHGMLHFWDTSDWSPILSIATDSEGDRCLALTRDGKLLAVGSGSGAIRIWRIRS